MHRANVSRGPLKEIDKGNRAETVCSFLDEVIISLAGRDISGAGGQLQSVCIKKRFFWKCSHEEESLEEGRYFDLLFCDTRTIFSDKSSNSKVTEEVLLM